MATETKKNRTEIESVIRSDRLEEWRKFVESVLDSKPGDERVYAMRVLRVAGKMISALADGAEPSQVIRLAESETTLVQMGMITRAICTFSHRGDEFRRWWNAWHDRVHEDDINPPSESEIQRRVQRIVAANPAISEDEARTMATAGQIFNPSQINVKGKSMVLAGAFDPELPLTRNPEYGRIVGEAARSVSRD